MEKFIPSEEEVLRCGEYLVDERFIEETWYDSYDYRIYVIKYVNQLYYYKSENEKTIEFRRLD